MSSLGKVLKCSYGQVGVVKHKNISEDLVSKKNQKSSEILRLSQQYPSDDFFCLGQLHGDICDLPSNVAPDFWNYDIQKQHLPPTQKNFESLPKTNFVFLERDPLDIVESLIRDETVTYGLGYIPLLSKNTRYKKLLIQELQNWLLGWKRKAPDQLWVSFDDLINNPRKTLNNILNEFSYKEISLPDSFELERERVPLPRKI